MSFAEKEMLCAIYEMGGGQGILVPFDKVAAHLATTITAVRTISMLLQNRNFAMVTFGGVQLTPSGLREAKHEHEIYTD